MRRPKTCGNIKVIDGTLRRCKAPATTERDVERDGRRRTVALCGGCAVAHDMGPGTQAPAPALDWTNPDACRAWLADLRERVTDAVAVGEDQTDSPSKRHLGRAGAVQLLGEACHHLDYLFGVASRGLPESGHGGPPAAQ
jgi:hypothetical protein